MNGVQEFNTTVSGIGVGRDVAVGRLFFVPRRPAADTASPPAGSKNEERERLHKALEKSLQEIEELRQSADSLLGEEEAAIFSIHGMMLQDPDILDLCYEEIQGGRSAEQALEAAEEDYRKRLLATEDDYLAARAADLRDVLDRVRRHLHGTSSPLRLPPDPVILVAEDLTPSETLGLSRDRVLGFVTFAGSPTSHTAILARALGIPALIAVGNLSDTARGTTAILDAPGNRLLLFPDDETISRFQSRVEEAKKPIPLQEARPSHTKSGKRILVYANVGGGVEAEAAEQEGAEGIGLLRSEFLYLANRCYPTEEALFESYRGIAEKIPNKKLIIRTLDVGADKKPSYFDLPHESNPALGLRGVRICLAREELFKTQLRAILRASAFSHIALMIPMIVSPKEVTRCRELLSDCMEELKQKGQKYDPHMEFGIMIETPASVMLARELAAQVDFFSVGTNDLTQYTLAADRQNAALSSLIESGREPVLRMISLAADAIHSTGGWIGICGEMASDLRLTQRFAHMGIDELSVSVPYLDQVRRQISLCD